MDNDERVGVDPQLNECAREVVDAALRVHRTLGPGFLESVYEEALATEFEFRQLAFERQVAIEIHYRGKLAGRSRLDFLVAGRLVVELKASETILAVHRAQLLSYLKATGHPLGLLINFNVRWLRDGLARVIWQEREMER